jgi:hypothetical protein
MLLCVTAISLLLKENDRLIVINLLLGCKIYSVILLNIEVPGTRTINYRIWWYFVRNVVWPSCIKFQVCFVKLLTFVHDPLQTVSFRGLTRFYVCRNGSVKIMASNSWTPVAPNADPGENFVHVIRQ